MTLRADRPKRDRTTMSSPKPGTATLRKEEVRRQAVDDVQAELLRQDDKWGDVREEPAGTWALILSEEFGELSKDLLEGALEDSAYREAIQVAAVGVAIATDLRMGYARDAQDPDQPLAAGTWALMLSVKFGALSKAQLEGAPEGDVRAEATRVLKAAGGMLADLRGGHARHTPKANS